MDLRGDDSQMIADNHSDPNVGGQMSQEPVDLNSERTPLQAAKYPQWSPADPQPVGTPVREA